MYLGGDTGSERSNIKKKKGPPMALRESGSPSLRVHSEAPHDYWAEFDAPSHDHPTLQRAAWVVLFFPLFAAFAAPVLYLLYALGFI